MTLHHMAAASRTRHQATAPLCHHTEAQATAPARATAQAQVARTDPLRAAHTAHLRAAPTEAAPARAHHRATAAQAAATAAEARQAQATEAARDRARRAAPTARQVAPVRVVIKQLNQFKASTFWTLNSSEVPLLNYDPNNNNKNSTQIPQIFNCQTHTQTTKSRVRSKTSRLPSQGLPIPH